jgi:hypothetical protein
MMHILSRRSFSKFLLAATTLPMARIQLPTTQVDQTPLSAPAIPDSIAGRALNHDERALVAKFLTHHDEQMAPLRKMSLPNSLSPNFRFASPEIKHARGEGE